MSVESRLREASSELEVVAAQTAIPELSQRTKLRPLTGLLICVAFVAAVAFPLLFSERRDSSGVGQCRPNATCTFATVGAVSSTIESNTADAILDHINELREENDISRLAANDDLRTYARLHSVEMASSGLAHSDISDLIGPFTIVGENIGYGPNWTSVLEAHAASPVHYANMIESRFTVAGVGVDIDSAGTVWITVVFATPSLP
jgi:hypothetical protein